MTVWAMRLCLTSGFLSVSSLCVRLQHIKHDIRLLLSNFKIYNKGEDATWIEAIQEALLSCVDGACQPTPTSLPQPCSHCGGLFGV